MNKRGGVEGTVRGASKIARGVTYCILLREKKKEIGNVKIPLSLVLQS